MKKTMTRAAVAAACVLVLGAAATAQEAKSADGKPSTAQPVPGGQAISLKPMFTSGQEFEFAQHFVRMDSMTLAGMGDRSAKMDQTNGWKCKVVSADDKGAVLELQFASVKAEYSESMKQGEKSSEPMTQTWDSAKPADDKDGGNAIVSAFGPVLESRFKVSLDATGTITGVEAMETPSVPISKMAQYVRQTVEPELIKQRLQAMFSVRPGEAKAIVGEEWKVETMMGAPPLGVEKTTTKRSISKMEGEVALVSIIGSSELVPLKEGEKAQGEITSSSITGTCAWDTKKGMCRSLDWTQKTDMNVDAQGFKVSRKSEWTMTITPK